MKSGVCLNSLSYQEGILLKLIKQPVCFFLPVILSFVLFSACSDNDKNQPSNINIFSCYRKIPCITDDEMRAIEALKDKHDFFVYGMPLSTEAFENANGEINGFSALFCEWLTQLFGIEFRPVLYDWLSLLSGLESGEISFSGELTSTPARLDIYHMTSAIASRPVMGFRISGSRPLWEIRESRPIRAGFIQGAATINAVTSEMERGTFEIVEINDFSNVYNSLKSGYVDVFYI
jgi:ABC-type amino acid transport substrate-binding protein